MRDTFTYLSFTRIDMNISRKLEGECHNLRRIESQGGLIKTLGNAGIASSIQRIKSLVDQAIRNFNVRGLQTTGPPILTACCTIFALIDT